MNELLMNPEMNNKAAIRRLRKIEKAAWDACWTFFTANNREDVIAHDALRRSLGKDFTAALKKHQKEQL